MLRVGNNLVLRLRDNIVQVESEDGERWEADEYELTMPWRDGVETQVSENFDAWLERAKAHDYAKAAAEIRARRDALLAATDKMMRIDRLGLEVPTGTTFTSWLNFLRGIGSALAGAWAVYSQALRDIPQQEGFPYNVTWPNAPEED